MKGGEKMAEKENFHAITIADAGYRKKMTYDEKIKGARIMKGEISQKPLICLGWFDEKGMVEFQTQGKARKKFLIKADLKELEAQTVITRRKKAEEAIVKPRAAVKG